MRGREGGREGVMEGEREVKEGIGREGGGREGERCLGLLTC